MQKNSGKGKSTRNHYILSLLLSRLTLRAG